ncbi:putative metal-dependent hydrolase [Polaromonas sp. CF318]|uniref:M48 family metallopeptidase n=1 Tax=Polaromonas sp. CF318 TaxID=1144318 RepID=UPI000270E3B0|nr:putative metal-dependent hydrolase [Polaromonas sp. CF318]
MMQRLLQFTLDLFDAHPAPPDRAASPKSAKPPAKPRPKKPPTSTPRPPAAPEPEFIGPQLPAQTLQQALAPATFRHPRATRETVLDGIVVAYEFRRSKRKTIGFSAGADGLTVSAPKWVPLYEIDKAVLEKSGWILAKLQETRERHERMESARIDWKDGTTLPFLGEQVIVVIDPRHAFGGVGAELKPRAAEVLLQGNEGEAGDMLPGVAQMTLHVGLPHNASAEQIRDAVQAWLMRQAKRIFVERLNHFAPQLGVQWHKLSLSSAGTRWGSASADGSIRLNWRLVHFRQSVIDYVVVHELSHLRVMDHSPRFWDTVRTIVPDYAELRGQLKDEAIPRW